MTRSSTRLFLIATILFAAFVLPAVRATEDESDDVCSLIRDNLSRHATKMIAANDAEEYVQSFAETLKMQEVLKLWTSNNCNVASSDQPEQTLSSSGIHVLSSIKRLAQISIQSAKVLVNKLHKDFTSLIEHITALTQSGLDKQINEFISHSKNSSQSNEWSCIICGALVKLAQNDALLKKQNIANYMSNVFCKLFPSTFQSTCTKFIQTVEPFLIEAQLKKHNADVICAKSGACAGKYTQCLIDGKSNPNPTSPNPAFEYILASSKSSNLFVSPWAWVVELLKSFADNHLPVVDLDNDGFSTIPTLRGYDWRGKDCNDVNKKVYPGVKTFTGVDHTIDFNCNGISGFDKTHATTYKNHFCSGSQQLGVVTMGDSVGAHFQIPPAYLNVTLWSEKPFHDILTRISNEFDLPMESATTGSQFNAPHMNSLYKYLLENNRCNRNDYQNLGVNGAMSTDSLNNIKAIRRNPSTDHPVLMIFELVGNDVCDPAHSFDAMTKPDVFRQKVLEMWNFLDSTVPAGSHMLILGVADGRILYDTLKDKVEPIGASYPDFYDYLNCLGLSPCWGYMNTDETTRNLTADWATTLNGVYASMLADPTIKFKNFDQVFYELPTKEIITRAVRDGYTAQDIIEPVDGFHPSQLANEYLSEILWENINRDRPNWIPAANPHNAEIDALFGSPFEHVSMPIPQSA